MLAALRHSCKQLLHRPSSYTALYTVADAAGSAIHAGDTASLLQAAVTPRLFLHRSYAAYTTLWLTHCRFCEKRTSQPCGQQCVTAASSCHAAPLLTTVCGFYQQWRRWLLARSRSCCQHSLCHSCKQLLHRASSYTALYAVADAVGSAIHAGGTASLLQAAVTPRLFLHRTAANATLLLTHCRPCGKKTSQPCGQQCVTPASSCYAAPLLKTLCSFSSNGGGGCWLERGTCWQHCVTPASSCYTAPPLTSLSTLLTSHCC
jgi:hypothetical protein